MLALDHIVIPAANAEKISLEYGNQFSIKTIKGGQHEQWGTYNYLSYFANDSYMEWLGVQDEQQAKRSDNPLIQHLVYVLEENIIGPFQFALRTSEMDNYVAHFQENNIPFKGPNIAERKKPDGSTLKWRMLFPEYDHKKNVLPFLIEWENPKDVFGHNSLFNRQSITKINYGGVDKETFARIYQLKSRKLNKNLFPLHNSKILFAVERKLEFDVV